jgi:hypothetical protein
MTVTLELSTNGTKKSSSGAGGCEQPLDHQGPHREELVQAGRAC